MHRCWRCGREIEIVGRVGRQDLCDGCSSPMHACRNCKDWDRAAHNQCREPQAEYVADRENANFCNFFSFKRERPNVPDETASAKERLAAAFGGAGDAATEHAAKVDDARARLERAFGSGRPDGNALKDPAADDARSRLDELFKK
jgi:hypothetical protein